MDNNFKKKTKFIENSFFLDKCDNNIKQPFYVNDLIKNNYNVKNKTSLELKNTLDPYDYDLPYCNKIKGEEEFVYYSPYDQGPGRGFGNLNVNNKIRKSESSRDSTVDFKLYRESEIIDRFEFIDDRYTNPNNLVLPFPRSGETTRKNEHDDQSLFSNNINKYNFNSNHPDDFQNITNHQVDYNIQNNESYQDYNIQNNESYQADYNFQNNLIANIENQNKSEQQKQINYKKKLIYIESVINKLKIQYENNLTKEIISQYLVDNPPEKYISLL